MGFLHASASSPALCRACGAAIRTGELRFGSDEGEGAARRQRWLHIGCAAERSPEALFRALELGGWQAVPKEDHYELRRLMGDARERDASAQRPFMHGPTHDESGSLWSPGWLRGLWQRYSNRLVTPWAPQVASSGPANASRIGTPTEALLEQARERELTPELERAWVFADGLQNRGDARGELLALELAAALAGESEQARALQRSARAAWQRLGPSLAGSLRASPALRLRWRGGFLLGARPRGGAEISGLLASPAARSLTRIRVEFCTQEELDRLVAGVLVHRRPLVRLDLPDSRLSDLSGLSEVASLRALRVGDRFDPQLLERLPELRALGLGGRAQPRARELAAAPELERLELVGPNPGDLEGLARHLPRLRELSLFGMSASEGPRFLAGAERLERLRLPDTPIRSLAELPALPRLRALTLVPANLPLVRELGRMRELERLALLGGKVGELDSIAALERLEHLALSATRVRDLTPLRALPRLRSLVLDGGDLRRMAGLAELGLERLELLRLANLDLALIAGMPRLRSLTLDLGGRRPRGLDALARMTELRELSIPQALLDELAPIGHALARIEILTLEGGERPPRAKLLQALPELRRLILPGHDPAALARMAEALPEVAIEGDPAPRDLLGLHDPFDWRAVGWPDAPQGASAEWDDRGAV
ncbi:hypothetical protein ACNOYE_20730 [Nannocystaceae bacterium ST9]